MFIIVMVLMFSIVKMENEISSSANFMAEEEARIARIRRAEALEVMAEEAMTHISREKSLDEEENNIRHYGRHGRNDKYKNHHRDTIRRGCDEYYL